MCIIAIKESGIQFPGPSLLETMWNNNPDGAGIMWAENNKVHISKGFMTYESFNAFIEEWKKSHDTLRTSVVFHFRISTHGGINQQCCHPFPVVDDKSSLKKLELDTDLGVVHNGIIPITPRTGISDTMEYILTQLAAMKHINRKFYREKNWRKLIQNAIQSKMAFLTSDGKVYKIGEFNKDDNGMIYSNYSWETPRYKSYAYPYSSWDYNYDDDYYGDYYCHTYKSFNDIDYGTTSLQGINLDDIDIFSFGLCLGEDRNVYIVDYSTGYAKKLNHVYANDSTGHPIIFNKRDSFELPVIL